jgi:hypothetical protein
VSKYAPLRHWLHETTANHISATFEQIETILGFKLPDAARQRPQWWANEYGDTKHVQSLAWLDDGFHTRNLNLVKETIDFERGIICIGLPTTARSCAITLARLVAATP